MSRMTRHFVWFTVLVLGVLACGGIGRSIPATQTPTPASPESADTLAEEWQQALQVSKESGEFTLTVTEGQLTAFVATKLAEQPKPALSDPQVFLRDGQVQIIGKVTDSGITATAKLVLEVSLSAEGLPQFELVSAEIGPFPIPEEMLKNISRSLNDAITGEGLQTANIQIESIEISDGFMTITGKRK